MEKGVGGGEREGGGKGIDPIFQSRRPTVFEFRHKPLVPCRASVARLISNHYTAVVSASIYRAPFPD